MKFLCVGCDEAMDFIETEGPDRGSLAVTFGCPQCGRKIILLTNPWETQVVSSLGVKIGGRTVPYEPLEQTRTALASQKEEALIADEEIGVKASSGSAGCPFTEAVSKTDTGSMKSETFVSLSRTMIWTQEAEKRLERVPSFVRPMASMAIENFAREKGYREINTRVMDEARDKIGM